MPIRTTLEIPKTIARNKALATLYGTLGGYDPSSGVPVFSQNSLTFIAGVTDFRIKPKRGATERRELNAANFGRRQEMVPGLLDYDTATLKRVMFYDSDFMLACGFQDINPDMQAFPMLFVLRLPSPNIQAIPEQRLVFQGTWIGSNPYMFSVEEKEDVRMVQEIDLNFAQVNLLNT